MATLDQDGNVLPDEPAIQELPEVQVTGKRLRVTPAKQFDWQNITLALIAAAAVLLLEDLTGQRRRRR